MTINEIAKELLEGKRARRQCWNRSNYIEYDKCVQTFYAGDEYSNLKTPLNFNMNDLLATDYEVYTKPILDREERPYLRAVLKPYKDQIEYIEKDFVEVIPNNYRKSKICEELHIEFKEIDGVSNSITLPHFERNTMYKGMETKVKYTPDELELF